MKKEFVALALLIAILTGNLWNQRRLNSLINGLMSLAEDACSASQQQDWPAAANAAEAAERLVGERLRRLAALETGNKLPDIAVADLKGANHSIDSMLVEGRYNVIFVGSSYCRQCTDIKKELAHAFPEMNILEFDVDSIAGGWDAPLMQQLEIDHIPYLMLVDAERRIAARDIRIWEIERKVGK